MEHVTGQIRCGRITRGSPHPRLDGYVNINVTSSCTGKWRALSPMVLGPLKIVEHIRPCALYPTGIMPGFTQEGDKQVITAVIMENVWQYSKIFSVDIDGNNNIQPSFFERRAHGMVSDKPKRRVFPKKCNIQTVAAYHDGKILGYVDSRAYYCYYYYNLTINHPIYRELQQLMMRGHNVLVLDFDAPEQGHTINLTRDYIISNYHCVTQPFGHGLLLCAMLLGVYPWVTN